MLQFRSLLRCQNLKSILAVVPQRCFHVPAAGPETQYLEVSSLGKPRRLAYQKIDGIRSPGIIYIPGLMSHKAATKATMLDLFCKKFGFPYVRYDPSGLGESKDIKITEANYSLWLEDASEMLTKVTEGPQLIIGSSLGCWLSAHLAKRHPEKFNSVLLLAPAFNFGRKYQKVLLSQLPKKLVEKYEADEVVMLYNPDYGEFPLRKSMFEDMMQYELSMEPGSIPLSCPVRIIHGVKDKDVPYLESVTLMNAVDSNDTYLTYVKHGGHQLSDTVSLELICDTILKMTTPDVKDQ